MPQTPTSSIPFQNQFLPAPQLISIPILPCVAASPSASSSLKPGRILPEVGSLAAVLHPSLGPARVCRVIGDCIQNDKKSFLVAFFQQEYSPCYVPCDYLFQLEPHLGFPLSDDEEAAFQRFLEEGEICVDWLLERIFSSAQNLAIGFAEMLFPQDRLQKATVKPTQEHLQRLMFQCVSCAALLIVCYVAGKWTIPEPKSRAIVSTILKTGPIKYISTQRIMAQVENHISTLLSIKDI
jgi:hypothetical protein